MKLLSPLVVTLAAACVCGMPRRQQTQRLMELRSLLQELKQEEQREFASRDVLSAFSGTCVTGRFTSGSCLLCVDKWGDSDRSCFSVNEQRCENFDDPDPSVKEAVEEVCRRNSFTVIDSSNAGGGQYQVEFKEEEFEF